MIKLEAGKQYMARDARSKVVADNFKHTLKVITITEVIE